MRGYFVLCNKSDLSQTPFFSCLITHHIPPSFSLEKTSLFPSYENIKKERLFNLLSLYLFVLLNSSFSLHSRWHHNHRDRSTEPVEDKGVENETRENEIPKGSNDVIIFGMI
jgi:hypothetical protein